MNADKEWITAIQAWRDFVREHPELGYGDGRWPFYNFLRLHKTSLIDADVIRWAKNRFWIANTSRFSQACFEAAARSMRAGLPAESECEQSSRSASLEAHADDDDAEGKQKCDSVRGSASLTYIRTPRGACIVVLSGPSSDLCSMQANMADAKSCLEEVGEILASTIDSAAAQPPGVAREQQGADLVGEPMQPVCDEQDLLSHAPTGSNGVGS